MYFGEGSGLGIAGAVGEPGYDLAQATQAMTRQMIPPGSTGGYSTRVTSSDPGTVLGAVWREPWDQGAVSCPLALYQEHGSAVALAGRVTNAGRFCGEELGPDEVRASRRIGRAILSAYTRQGPGFVARLEGPFALAIWDGGRRQLFLARDRLGIRPLYYYWNPGEPFIFGSKLRALLASGLAPAKLSHAGIHSYLVYGVTCEPFTAIENVYALPPAYWTVVQDGAMTFGCYWDLFAGDEVMTASVEQAAAELRPLLSNAVRQDVDGDDDTCIFLSGGLDSSLLAALARHETGNASTVSLIVEGAEPSEEPFIELMRQRLAARHVAAPLMARELDGWLDGYFAAMDQPTVDGLNVYAVSRAAHEHGFAVALYGVGGDELFGGVRHQASVRRMERAARLPASLRAPAGWLLGKTRKGAPGRVAREWLGNAATPGTAYDFLTRYYFDSELSRLWRGAEDADAMLGRLQLDEPDNFPALYSRLTLYYYLKNQLLRIADWAGAAHGLDIRAPFLDRTVVEWALKLPPEHKSGGYKPVLSRAAAGLVPEEILARPKKGFSVPLQHWMRREIRDEVDDVLRRPPSEIADLLDPDEMRRIWDDFLKTGDRWHCSWGLYTLCRWWERVRSREASLPLLASHGGQP